MPGLQSPFPLNVWYPAMWAHDLVADRLVERRCLDQPMVLFRDGQGRAVALHDACPHRQAPLHLGRLTPQGRLQCGYHGLEFEGDGRCARNPHGDGRLPSSMHARAFTLVERHSIIWLWMGDEPAREEAIPDFSLMDECKDDGFVRARDAILIRANYLLVADNLLDLSHANFLHEGILGLPEHCNAEVSTEQTGRVIHVRRWMPSVPIAKLHDLMFRRDGRPIDMWNEVSWVAPGCLVLTHGFSEPGRSQEEPFEFRAVHLLTPETSTSTHYSYGIVRRPGHDEPEVNKAVADTRRHVFENQDRVMLEAQQRMMDEPSVAGVKPILFTVDAASSRMRRVVDALRNGGSVEPGSREDAAG